MEDSKFTIHSDSHYVRQGPESCKDNKIKKLETFRDRWIAFLMLSELLSVNLWETFINFIYFRSERDVGTFPFSDLDVAHEVNALIKSHEGEYVLL